MGNLQTSVGVSERNAASNEKQKESVGPHTMCAQRTVLCIPTPIGTNKRDLQPWKPAQASLLDLPSAPFIDAELYRYNQAIWSLLGRQVESVEAHESEEEGW